MPEEGFKQSCFSGRTSSTNPYLWNVYTAVYSGDASDQTTFGVTTDGTFPLFGREHTLVAGVEGQQVKVVGTTGQALRPERHGRP